MDRGERAASRSWSSAVLSDAELVCLAVMQVLLPYTSEWHRLRYARKHQSF